MVLNTQPAGDVTVTVSGHASTDVSLDQTTLTFTSTTWGTAQEVTVTAGEDGDADDETDVTLSHAVASADDAAYNGISAGSVVVSITDNDTAGVTVSETGLTIVEGSSGSYTVVLNTQPAGDVTVTVSGHAGTDVSLDQTTLTFSATTWSTAQTVTVTAGQDGDADDETDVTLSHAVASTDDAAYNGISRRERRRVDHRQRHRAGVTVSETGLTIVEGNTGSYTVVLNTQPAGNVTVTVTFSAGTDVSLDQTTLTFSATTWSTAQTVTVTAGEDGDTDDETDVTLSHAVASTADTAYNGISAGSVVVSITDNDTAGVTVSETDLTIVEGSSGSYTVVLNTQPAGNVTVTVTFPAGTDVSLDQTTLTFSATTWSTAQTVTVTAGQDGDADDETDVTLSHAVTSAADTAYNGITAGSVVVSITDNDTANSAPTFPSTTAGREVAENTAAGQNVGSTFTATDDDGDTLTYTLEGADAASFDLVTTADPAAQIRTKTGVTYNHEAKDTYEVVVKADDGNSGTDTITVTITVTDVNEPPAQPAAPSVSATTGSSTSLDVSWTPPATTGPDIDNYDLQYRQGTSGSFTNGPQNVTGATASIPNLMANMSYQVQVLATNAEGDSPWSLSGTGSTNSDDATLSALTVNDGTNDLTLDPTFISGTFAYAADVGNAVTTVTLSATLNDDTAEISGVTLGGAAIADMVFTDDITVPSLVVGDNVIVVTVTAEDTTTQTYTVTVTQATATVVPESWSLRPSSMTSGNQFRLLFLSSTGRDATPNNIDTYNTWLQNLAAAGHADIRAYSAGFKVVGCTAAVDAIDNTNTTGTGIPIYWLNGNKAVDTYVEFYEGGWDNEANKNESGNNGLDTSNSDNYPFTGCHKEGTEYFGPFLTSRALGKNTVSQGRPNDHGPGHGPIEGNDVSTSKTNSRPLYGLSGVFEVETTTLSTDATLSALTITDVSSNSIALVPNFDAATTDYTAPVANDVDEVTIVPTVNDSSATYEIQDASGNALTDADGLASDFQVALSEGPNIIKVEVTAEYVSTTNTYEVMVARSFGPPTEVPENWSLKPSGLSVGSEFRLIFLSSNSRQAQSANIDTYNRWIQTRAASGHADIQAYSSGFRVVGCTENIDARDNTATTGTGVQIYWLNGVKVADHYTDFYNGDWDNEANDKNEDGTNGPDTSTVAGRPYTGCRNNGTEHFDETDSLALGNSDNNDVTVGRPNSTEPFSGPISSDQNVARNSSRPMYGLSGIFKVAAASDDATLSALTVNDGTSDLTLTPAFVSGTYVYEADVENAVDEVTLTATMNDDGATISAVTLAGTAIADTNFTDGISVPSLVVGDNVIVVTVTAEDASTQTYTVSVTRAAAATPTVSISADKNSAVFKEDDITYTLTRTGSTTAALPVMVTLTQTKDFLATTDLTETVTIAAGQTTETFTVAASSFQHFPVGDVVEAGTLTAAVQDDTDYDLGTPSSVAVSIDIGVTIRFEMASYTVGEAGGTLSVKLIARTGPDAPRPSSATGLIGLSSNNGSAINNTDFVFPNDTLNLLPAAFSADGARWKAEHTLTVSITNDTLYENSESFDLKIQRNSSALAYSLVDASGDSCGSICTVLVTITDDDTAGVSVSKSAITITEQDTTGDTYTVVLDSQPTANVTITIGGQSAADITAAPSPLTFTTTNWATAQTVTVTAANDTDTVTDTHSLTHSAASSDTDYSGISIANVGVTVNDNDTANSAPVFADTTANRSVAENTAAGQNVGGTLTATDSDGDTLTYTLEGTDAASFNLVTTTDPAAQIRTKSGVTYNHEVKSTYTVVVKADDGNSGTDTITVTITITDVAEAPGRPAAPNVTATSGSTTSLDVSWSAPTNTGPAIDNYDLRYQKTTESTWTNGPQNQTGIIAAIGSLDAGTAYRVQVRATNDEGNSQWSTSGNGTTSTPINSAPVFSTTTANREVAENTAAGQNVGGTFTATDSDGDTITYTLEGTNAASFDLITTGGAARIRTKSGVTYNHEVKSTYTVVVKADDGNTGTDTITVTITITDVNEAPGRPAAPDVTATSGSTTSLDVSWSAPTNTGPTIDNYDLQYRQGTSGSFTNGPQNVNGISSTIPNLTANTSYQVQVRATNDEGDSQWSTNGNGTTTALATPTVSISADNAIAVFKQDGITYTLTRTGSTTAALPVTVTLTQTKDFLAVTELSQTVTIPAGQTTETFTVAASSFQHFATGTAVEAGTLTAAVQDGTDYDLGTPSAVDVAIVIGITVRIELASYTVDEADGTLSFAIIARTGAGAPQPSSATGSVGVLTEDGSASNAVDFAFTDGAENFLPSEFSADGGVWQAESTYNVSITNDDLDEDDETFILAIERNLDRLTYSLVDASGNSCGSKCTVTATIVDDDTAGVTVSKTALTVTEEDMTGDTYTVVLDSQPTANVTITIGGQSAADITAVPSPMTFTTTNWGTAQTVTVIAGNDTDTVSDSVTLTHAATSTDTDYSGISIASVTVTVNDNDSANSAPTFSMSTESRNVAENTAAGLNVGGTLTATDSDGDTLTYTLEGTDAASFDIVTVSAAAQIRTKSGVTYNYEVKAVYTVVIKADDTNGGIATVTVNITLTDVNEPPGTPSAPSVSGTSGSNTSLTVSWSTPANSGPPIDNYDLQYRQGTSGSFTNGPQNVTGTTTTIPNLSANTSYQVQVRATNAEGDSSWSPSGAGSTSSPPVTPPGQVTGVNITPGDRTLQVTWTQVTGATGYKVQWKSGGQSYSSSRQATVSSGSTTSRTISNLDNGTEYTVRVIATKTGASDGTPSDDANGTPTAANTAPSAPRNLNARAVGDNRINLSWDAPNSDGGSNITGYKIQVSSNGRNWSDRVANTGNTNRTHSHTGLSVGDTRHYRIAAINSTGTGPYSNGASATTGLPQVNIAPATTTEGGDIVFTITISPTIDGFLSVGYGTGIESLPPGSMGAKKNDDYVPHHPAGADVQIGYGQSSVELTFTTVDDELVEGTEIFEIGLYRHNREGRDFSYGTRMAIATIRDDENGGQAYQDSVPGDTSTTATISPGNSVINRIETVEDADWYRTSLTKDHCYQIKVEGNSADETLTLLYPAVRGVYRSDGTSIRNTYENADGQGTTAISNVKLDTTGTYYIAAGLYRFENGGTFRMTLTDLGTTDRSCGAAKPGGPMQISVTDTSVRESSDRRKYMSFTVTLDRRADKEVRVDYTTVNGTATAGQDYEATSGTLIFDEGDEEQILQVPIEYDSNDEDDETLTLVLSNARGAEIERRIATGTIVDYSESG